MKKIFALLMALPIFFIGFVSADDMAINEGLSFDIVPGVMIQKIKKANYEKDLSIIMWHIAGNFKNQEMDSFYYSVNARYAQGFKHQDDSNYKMSNFNADIALGWSFPIFDNSILSPFVGFGFDYMNDIREDWKKTPIDTIDRFIKAYGLYAMVGFDAQFLASDSFSIDPLVGFGFYLNPKITYFGARYNETSSTTDPTEQFRGYTMKKKKYSAKNSIFFKARLPFVFYLDNWRFGCLFGYDFRPIKSDDTNIEINGVTGKEFIYKRHMFTLALIIGTSF